MRACLAPSPQAAPPRVKPPAPALAGLPGRSPKRTCASGTTRRSPSREVKMCPFHRGLRAVAVSTWRLFRVATCQSWKRNRPRGQCGLPRGQACQRLAAISPLLRSPRLFPGRPGHRWPRFRLFSGRPGSSSQVAQAPLPRSPRSPLAAISPLLRSPRLLFSGRPGSSSQVAQAPLLRSPGSPLAAISPLPRSPGSPANRRCCAWPRIGAGPRRRTGRPQAPCRAGDPGDLGRGTPLRRKPLHRLYTGLQGRPQAPAAWARYRCGQRPEGGTRGRRSAFTP